MNTIIIEHADEKLTALFKQIAEIAGVPLRTKPEKDGSEISNPELIKAINDYETNKTRGKAITAEDLKDQFEKLIADA